MTPTLRLMKVGVFEESCHALRKFYKERHKFIRLRFTDENQMRNYYQSSGESPLLNRLQQTIREGFYVGTAEHESVEKFHFLNYSNSALKEHSFWFVTPLKKFSPDFEAIKVFDYLGNFMAERNIFKRLARRG